MTSHLASVRGFLLCSLLISAGVATSHGGEVHAPAAELEAPFIGIPGTDEGTLGFDASGDLVAVAVRESGEIKFNLVEVGTDDVGTSTVTRFEADDPNVTIDSLAFDGRWIVWSDNRGDQFDVHAVDTVSGGLLRLTDHPADDVQVDADEGQAVWTRRPAVLVGNLTTGSTGILSRGAGFSPAPSIDEGIVAWSRMNGTSFTIVGRSKEVPRISVIGTDDRLALALPGLDASDGVVWTAFEMKDPDDPGQGYNSSFIQIGPVPPSIGGAREDGASVSRLSPAGVDAVHPVIGGGFVAWLQPTENGTSLMVVELESRDLFSVDNASGRAALSDELLVVSHLEGSHARLYALRLADAGQLLPESPGPVSWPLLISGAGFFAAAGAVTWFRRLRQKP